MPRTEIKTYPVDVLADNIDSAINSLMLCCIRNKTVPYVSDTPLPQDVNVVNGRHLGDINKIYLELKAADTGAKSLKWIYGSDAALMGLIKKPGTEPVMLLGNIRGGVDAQSVYLLEQFTDDSVQKALSLARSDDNKKKRTIAQNMLKNISEYDNGKNEAPLREQMRKNISENLKNTELLADVQEAYSNATEGYDENQKTIFSALNSYYIRQETGLALQPPLSEKDAAALISALEHTAKTPSPRLAMTLSECFLYSERMTHYDFSPNRVYTQEDLAKKTPVLAPVAAGFKPKKNITPEQDASVEVTRERELDIKPRHITHQRSR